MLSIITEAEKDMFISICEDTSCSKCMFYRYHNCCGTLQSAQEFFTRIICVIPGTGKGGLTC